MYDFVFFTYLQDWKHLIYKRKASITFLQKESLNYSGEDSNNKQTIYILNYRHLFKYKIKIM